MKTALLVIAQNGYQDVELAGTQNALLAAGFEVTLASSEAGPCIGKFGGSEEALFAVREVDALSYDVLAFIGGPGAGVFKDDPAMLDLIKRRAATGKLLGAICIAPTALAVAGVLDGKRSAVWDDGQGTQIKLLEQHGATYTGDRVTVDGTIVTANGPEAAEEFGQALAKMAV